MYGRQRRLHTTGCRQPRIHEYVGLHSGASGHSGRRLCRFLKSIPEGNIKAEYLLPTIVDQLLKEGKADVAVLETHDKWFGVTYQKTAKL